MKILIACDSFKGSLSSSSVARAIARGVHRADAHIETLCIPIADGGEGTIDAFLAADGGKRVYCSVHDPLGKKINAAYAVLEDGTAVIEMAQASGLPLLSGRELDPLRASTFGTGEMIRHALDADCRRFLIGIGGSATTDGGTGMLRALGVRFLDAAGNSLAEGGGALMQLAHIDMRSMDPRLAQSEIIVISDVNNPLCGEQGAARIFGPQKGCTQDDVAILDAALSHYADIIRRDINIDIRDCAGAGAAGGMGAGLMAFCHAQFLPGIDSILNAVRLESLLADVDLVLTGEGCIDGQSAFGKVPVGVARRVKTFCPSIPVFAVVGGIGKDAELVYPLGIDSIISITPGVITLEQSMLNCESLLEDAAHRLTRILLAVHKESSLSEQQI